MADHSALGKARFWHSNTDRNGSKNDKIHSKLCDSVDVNQDFPSRQLLDHTGSFTLKEMKTVENVEYGSMPNSPTNMIIPKSKNL